MIYVDQAQLDQVEYLLSQAMQGNHPLFDTELLRRVFKSDENSRPLREPLGEEAAYAVEPHVEKLLALPTLEQRRAFLEGLSQETQADVVRVYFNIVENNLFESITVRH